MCIRCLVLSIFSGINQFFFYYFFSAIFITSTLRATSITTPCNSTQPCWRKRSNSSTTSWTTWKSIYSRLEPIWHLEKVRNLISVFILISFDFIRFDLIWFDWFDLIWFYLTSFDSIWFILFRISSFYFLCFNYFFFFFNFQVMNWPGFLSSEHGSVHPGLLWCS